MTPAEGWTRIPLDPELLAAVERLQDEGMDTAKACALVAERVKAALLLELTSATPDAVPPGWGEGAAGRRRSHPRHVDPTA